MTLGKMQTKHMGERMETQDATPTHAQLQQQTPSKKPHTHTHTNLHGVFGVRNVEEVALHRAQIAEQHALHVVDNVRFERTVRLRVRDGLADLCAARV